MPKRAEPTPLGRDRLKQLIEAPAVSIQSDLKAGELKWLALVVLKQMENTDA